MDSCDSHKVENLHNHDMDHDSYQRIRPYSSRHSKRLISKHVQSLENHFGDNSSNAYDVHEIDSIPTVTESMEDDFQSCYSDFDADEDYDSDCSPISTASEFESSDEESNFLERLAEFDEDSDSDTEEKDSFSFREAFASWAISRNICQNAIDELLSIFRKFPWGQSMPKSCRSLVGTLRKVSLKPCAAGNYFHFGILTQLLKVLSVIDENSIPVEIVLKISVDGIPMSKSGKSQLWPLTGLISNLEFQRVFLIGLWQGESKPSNVNEFLREFIEEAKKLSDEGFTFRGKRIRFQIVLYICDAPARSFLKCIKSHTGFFGCPYCIQEGEYHGRTVFLETDSRLRTDFSFRQRVQEEHHLGDPDLEKLNCDMVLDFPNFPQHLIDLGVTRKMMRKWIVGPRPHKLRPAQIQQLSIRMVELQVFIPFEFARIPRSLDFFPQLKSTELALFNSYVGPIVLKNILPEREYKNFLVFHVAVKLMSSKKYCHSLNTYIKNLLIFFVNDSCVIYGQEFLSYNVHNLLHLGDQIFGFGPLYNFSAYPFESFYQIFKKLVRKGNQVLQ